MLNAAIVGLGWWGKVLVEAVQGKSDKINFVAGATRTKSKAEEFAGQQGFKLLDSYEDVIADPSIDAVVLATPHSLHMEQVIAAARADKNVFVEKPFTLKKSEAKKAVAATEKAGVTLALGVNRRFHPAIAEARKRVQNGDLGTLLHCEGTMSSPTGLSLPPESWRTNREETPGGGLTPMGIHVIDTMIDLFGPIDDVFCHSVHRAVPADTDDTTSMLFRLQNGMTAYMATMLATGVSYRFQIFGTGGSIEIRKPDLSHFEFIPTAGGQASGHRPPSKPEVLDFSGADTVKAELEAFADAAQGGPAYPVPTDDMIHGSAVIEAIVESMASGAIAKVR